MGNIGRFNAAIHRNAQSIINCKLRDLDIRSGQQEFFYVISKNEGISQKELSEFSVCRQINYCKSSKKFSGK